MNKRKVSIITIMIMLVVLVVGCNSKKEPEPVQEINKECESSVAPVDIKEVAIEAEFIKVNGDEVEEGTSLYLSGEASVVFGTDMFGEISLTTKEGDGHGMYTIVNLIESNIDIKEGDNIKFWGAYGGKNDKTGIPIINAIAYEKIEGTESNSEVKENNRKGELEQAIKKRIDDGDYEGTKLDKITINDNLGEGESNTYIGLVYFKLDRKNTRNTGNKLIRMYSDDLVATLAKQGIKDISEIAVFWEDEYNSRNVKYAYKYKDNGFYIEDIQGE